MGELERGRDGEVPQDGEENGEKSSETRFFLTSLADVRNACAVLRSYWGVENGLHWEPDVVFGEDLSQLRKDNSAVNMNIIRKLAINAKNALIRPS